jgi:hypothetical protein
MNEVKKPNPGWTLIDAELRSIKYPSSFYLEDLQDRLKIKEGKSVKIGVEQCPVEKGEKFWVTVTRVSNHGHFVGMIDNHLVLTHAHGLEYRDLIAFEPKHIISLHVPTTEEVLMLLSRCQTHSNQT